MTALSSGSSIPGWGILSFPVHEEQTGNKIKAQVHLQQLKKAKHFLLAKGEEQRVHLQNSFPLTMIISYTLLMAV